MSNVVPFRRSAAADDGGEGSARMAPGNWLRQLADLLDGEVSDTPTEPPALVLAIMNETPDGNLYRVRVLRYDCSRIEAVGLLHTAADDLNSD